MESFWKNMLGACAGDHFGWSMSTSAEGKTMAAGADDTLTMIHVVKQECFLLLPLKNGTLSVTLFW